MCPLTSTSLPTYQPTYLPYLICLLSIYFFSTILPLPERLAGLHLSLPAVDQLPPGTVAFRTGYLSILPVDIAIRRFTASSTHGTDLVCGVTCLSPLLETKTNKQRGAKHINYTTPSTLTETKFPPRFFWPHTTPGGRLHTPGLDWTGPSRVCRIRRGVSTHPDAHTYPGRLLIAAAAVRKPKSILTSERG